MIVYLTIDTYGGGVVCGGVLFHVSVLPVAEVVSFPNEEFEVAPKAVDKRLLPKRNSLFLGASQSG